MSAAVRELGNGVYQLPTDLVRIDTTTANSYAEVLSEQGLLQFGHSKDDPDRPQIKIATAQEEQMVAKFGAVSLRAFSEVETGLTNEQLLGKRLPYAESAVRDHGEAVRVALLRYKAGSMDLLSVLQLQESQIQSEAALIDLRNSQLANRINLHLALGGSFDSSPANFSGIVTHQP